MDSPKLIYHLDFFAMKLVISVHWQVIHKIVNPWISQQLWDVMSVMKMSIKSDNCSFYPQLFVIEEGNQHNIVLESEFLQHKLKLSAE